MKNPKKILIEALSDGENPRGIKLVAQEFGDPGIYQEISVSAFKEDECIADIIVGINEDGEVRVMITVDSNGDGDKELLVYPERPLGQAIKRNL
jgi:hypothetical protein